MFIVKTKKNKFVILIFRGKKDKLIRFIDIE